MSENAIFHTSQLERVSEGMTVVDESGTRLGRVKRIRMGDPGAVTTAGQTGAGESVGIAVAPASSTGGTSAFGGVTPIVGAAGDNPGAPDPIQTRLRRVGFIELEDSELKGADAYIPGDRIAEVNADTVRLRPAAQAGTPPIESTASMQESSLAAEPMLRTRVESPRYVMRHGIRIPPTKWTAGAAGGIALLGVGGAATWLYERRRRESRLDARLRHYVASLSDYVSDYDRTRVGGVGGALLLMLMLGTVVNRARGRMTGAPNKEFVATVSPRRPAGVLRQRPVRPAVGLAVAALILGVLWRRRTRRDEPEYIGTPGVESASGRDRTRSGELPHEYGVERGRN